MAEKYPKLFEERTPQPPAEPGTIEVLSAGAEVEARHEGGAIWFQAKVVKREGKGGESKYSLAYDDGDKEQKVPRHRIRRIGDKERRLLHVGEKVDARHGGAKGNTASASWIAILV